MALWYGLEAKLCSVVGLPMGQVTRMVKRVTAPAPRNCAAPGTGFEKATFISLGDVCGCTAG